jgi:hypothetical protein
MHTLGHSNPALKKFLSKYAGFKVPIKPVEWPKGAPIIREV